MRRDWRVWIPISCGCRLVPPMQCPRLVPPMSKNHGVSQMQRRPPWSPCRPPWYVQNVPSLANWTAWNVSFFTWHTNCILEFWISTLLETISWVLFQVPLRRRWSWSVVQSSRSLKSSQGSERWLSDWRLGFCCCICILYLFVFVSRGVSDSSATNHVGVPSEIEQFACRLWFVKRPGY